jgi:hypothetical protein
MGLLWFAHFRNQRRDASKIVIEFLFDLWTLVTLYASEDVDGVG